MNRQQVGKWITATSLALGAAAAIAQQGPVGTYPQVPVTTDATAQSTGTDNYGFCSTFGGDTSCYHNWLPTRPKNKVLLYTRTAGVRQASLGTPLAAGLNPPLGADNNTQNDMIRLLNAQGIAVDYTEDVHALSSSTANLNQYAAIIFFSTSGDVLFDHGNAVVPALAVSGSTTAYLDAGRTALRQYVRAGGGFVGVNYALGQNLDEGVSDFPWLTGLLGANIYDSAGFQNGTIVIQGSDSSTAGIGTTIPFQDSWFTLVPYPRNVKFLATVDASTLVTKKAVHPGHGAFWPVAWCHNYDGGRAWITSLGTDASATSDLTTTPSPSVPNRAAFQSMLVNGIKSAMGLTPFCT
jgi:type 1 glutamine amidotransferase